MGRIEFRDIGDDHDYTLNMICCGLFLEVKYVYNTVSAEPFKVSDYVLLSLFTALKRSIRFAFCGCKVLIFDRF